MLDVKSVPKLFGRKALFVTLLALLIVAAMLFGARVAEADSIWHQSYQRGSASDVCVAQPGETRWQDSWGTNPGWSPSWEQWANNGNGGWTCTRSIAWDQTLVPASSGGGVVTYRVGDVGPGGGLVFLISGGLSYEMAPKTWSGGSEDLADEWCSDFTNSVATNSAVGTGNANTTAMLTNAAPFVACTASAANAVRAYAGGGFTDWFLPSMDELNAMCDYSRNLTASLDPTVSCYGAGPSGTTQDVAFAGGAYGFASVDYWSSSQFDASTSFAQNFASGDQGGGTKNSPTLRVRPIRAF